MKIIIVFILFILQTSSLFAQTKADLYKYQQVNEQQKSRPTKYHFGYPEKEHSTGQIFKDVGFAYALTWIFYPLTQPETVGQKGSWDKYQDNLGKIVFDHDAPFWNVMVHPISGSQLYLYYRANGYTKEQSFLLTTISSAMFEFTVEVYTEPASAPDLFNTPVLGSILGYGIENLSMYLLNTGNPLGRFLGHVINPSTFFWFYDGKMIITPDISKDGQAMFKLYMDF